MSEEIMENVEEVVANEAIADEVQANEDFVGLGVFGAFCYALGAASDHLYIIKIKPWLDPKKAKAKEKLIAKLTKKTPADEVVSDEAPSDEVIDEAEIETKVEEIKNKKNK